MPQVTIIRHGQTNRNIRLDSDPDKIRNSRINQTGREQASELVGNYDLVILSPLKRTLDTYIHSQIQTGELQVWELVHERRNATTYNCLDLAELVMESYEEVRERARQTIQKIKGLPHNKICIIGHGTFNECFLQEAGMNIVEPDIDNCSQFTVTI